MHILHVVPYYEPALRYGGPVRSVKGLAEATARTGHRVQVFTTNIDGDGISNVPVGVPIEKNGVEVTYFDIGYPRKIFRAPDMTKALVNQMQAIDILHVHTVWCWPTIAAARSACAAGVPYVLAPRGMLVKDLIERQSKLAKLSWLWLFDRRTVRDAAALHVTSESEANDLLRLGFGSGKLVVLPNGVELPKKNIASNNGLNLSMPYILFLGRISWKKGLDRLIGALKFVVGVRLVIAGYDENGYKDKIFHLAQESGVVDRVDFIGEVEGTDKNTLIRQASCLVLPSYHENFGMVVIEAMATGTPVVVSEAVGLSTVVRAANAGIVTLGEPSDLALALNKIISNPKLARYMGERGREFAYRNFDWDNVAQKALKLYRSCIEGSEIINSS